MIYVIIAAFFGALIGMLFIGTGMSIQAVLTVILIIGFFGYIILGRG